MFYFCTTTIFVDRLKNSSYINDNKAIKTKFTYFHSTLINDGCYILLPNNVFDAIGLNEEIFYLFIVSQQVCFLVLHSRFGFV